MKLKYVIGILLLLNAAALAWQWNVFLPWGWGPDRHREPERVQQQIRPEALKFEIVPASRPANEASGALPDEAARPAPSDVNPATLLPSEASAVASPAAAVDNPAGRSAQPVAPNLPR